MSSLSAIATSGMRAADAALRTSAHNLANLETAGFKRERVINTARAEGGGACQGSCRSVHAAEAFFSVPGRYAMLTITSRSGFKATASIGSQLRVWRDHRAGLRSRAWRYSA